MKTRARRLALGLVLGAPLLAAVCYALAWARPAPRDSEPAGRPAQVRPDYDGAVIPPNIAPLNFCVDEPGSGYAVRLAGDRGEPLDVPSRTGRIAFPLRSWKRLLRDNRGAELRLEVHVRGADGRWRRFDDATLTVAREDIDPYVVYRHMDPLYRFVRSLEICERSTETFKERTIVNNEAFGGCLNCHTFLNNRPDTMVLHVRSGLKDYGAGMLLVEHGSVAKVDTSSAYNPGFAGFPAWHPSGKAVAFSINKVRQFFHTARAEVRDVVDLASDLALYRLDTHEVTSCKAITRPDVLETFPAWSPDGTYLYYCSTPMPWTQTLQGPDVERYREVRYDLMRIRYDLATGAWGEPETVLASKTTGLSITEPRVSPDGRLMAFCMSDYGTFPAFQASSDLYLMDLKTGRYEPMACNSNRSESWHSWSSNSRWLAFSSKRADGQFLRVYFTYVDQEGKSHRPFLMPQEDPAFYDSFIQLHQMPELITGPVQVSEKDFVDAITREPWTKAGLSVTSASPRAGAAPQPERPEPEPWGVGPP
jgi:hypothetical protein